MTERRERIKQHVVKHTKKYEGRRSNVYLDPKGIPTIGYGYALGDKNGNIKSTADINAEMNRAMNTQGKEYFSESDRQKLTTAKSEADLRGVGPTLSDSQMDTMLEHHADEHLERVDNHVKNLGVDPETLTDGQRAALTDLSIRGGNNLVGSKSPKLNKAIVDGDDEAFLREVEEGSNGDGLPGNDRRMEELGNEIRREKGLPPRNDNSTLPGATKETSPTTPGPQSSILDGIGDTLGAVGSAAATVGHMAYNTAMSVGKDTLVHMVTQAANGGGGKAVLAQAAQVAMAQTLSRMHGLVMQEVERQQPSQPWRTPGIAGPILDPDGTTQESIERTINDPRNAGIFNDIASRVERILTQVGDAHPAAVLVSKVMEVLRGGDIKVQPNILVPDLFLQEDGPTRQPQGDERAVEIAGVSIPMRLPEVRVIMDESGAVSIPGRTPDFNPNASSSLHRGADGAIEVKSYTRGDGTQVAAHTRSTPDGIISNNFSFRRKR